MARGAKGKDDGAVNNREERNGNDNGNGNGNGWTQYQKLVLAELERHSYALASIETHLNKLEVEIATLKVRASLFGLLAGAIPALAVVLFEVMKK